MTESDPKNIVYISDRIVPNGNAGGVRIDHITRMLQSIFSKVSVISFGEQNFKNFEDQRSFHKIHLNKNFIGKLSSKFFSGYKAAKIYSEIMSNNDIIILYSTNIFFTFPVLLFAKYKRNKIFFDVVENFHHQKFFLGYFSPKYWLFRTLMRYVFTQGNGVFAISKAIAKYFNELGVSFFILPPLFSYQVEKLSYKSIKNKIDLI